MTKFDISSPVPLSRTYLKSEITLPVASYRSIQPILKHISRISFPKTIENINYF
ncbi:hypothetical protein DESPIG_01413 [Desulfovibrio piger ATCC 29098]|uniref:Uncharacterized protein n=1 Tax=Desulfovibrio piger ATCC 29098 TaxID=411464 RepID=B6WTK7_9BACT|nr:hypothetical protein DESPIG_01413 [Desulfovibrio piger ATCC 29098]